MKNKCIALYLRLSMADGDLGKNNKDESNSIENQRALLEKYIEESDELTGDTREYIDDGYTGTNFNRPGFQKMLNDAGEGEISTILVKDLSRLGRDYIGVGDYVEQIFPMFGVRFIAVNNSFDSDDCTGAATDLNFAVSNLINSLYSRDLSKKIRSSLETTWEQGRATAPRVPFGYQWDKNSEKKWELDPVASKYVREIFDYALAGNNTTQIAVKLNSEHIPTPGLYKKMSGTIKSKSLNLSPDSEKLWEPTKVRIILKSYEYTGALVMGKRVRFKTGENMSKHLLPKEDQIIVENAHDAIVSVEEFNLAQEVIRPGVSESHKSTASLPLQKILRCGNCHRLMRFSIKNGEYVFHCDYARKFGSFSACQGTYYRESEINTRVMYAIRQVINIAGMLDERMENEYARTSLTFEFPDPEKIRSEIETLKAERVRQYESYSDRIITREAYMKRKNEIAERIESLEKDLQKAEEVPFGYLWNKNSEKKWEIDPVASKYVRKVFDYALKGDNTRQIAVNMNFEHIPTPGVYAKMTAHPGKGRMNISPDSEKLWSTGTVSEIIRKYEYTGALIMRKRERLGSEHVSVHVVPKEDQIVIENAHDAIVTSEEFNLAQGAVRTVQPIAFKTCQDFPLKRIVRCGTCRRLMGYSVKDGEYGFHCEYAREFGSFSSCRNMFYRESEINTRVMYAIRQAISIAGMLDERMENENARTPLTFEFPDPEKIRSEIEILKAERVRQYEAYSDRTITRENYVKKKNELAGKISSLEEKLLKAEELIKNDEKVQTDIKNVANAGNEIPTGVGLTAETTQKFVESVYIYDETHMEIVFKCEDTILAAFDKCTANTDGVLISMTEEESSGNHHQIL